MGKKGHGKVHGGRKLPTKVTNVEENLPKKLSRQKRNEVNQLVDKLLKGGFILNSRTSSIICI